MSPEPTDPSKVKLIQKKGGKFPMVTLKKVRFGFQWNPGSDALTRAQQHKLLPLYLKTGRAMVAVVGGTVTLVAVLGETFRQGDVLAENFG